MASVLLICGTLVAAYFSTFIYCLIRNLFNVRKTGLPAIIVPFDQNHILWMMFSVPYQQWFREHLPEVVYSRLSLCMYGWEFHEKLRPFEKFSGPRGNDKTYVLVTCGRFELWSRDAEVCAQIVGRPRDFTQLDISNLFVRITCRIKRFCCSAKK